MNCSNAARRLHFQGLPLKKKKFYVDIKSTSLKKKVCKRIADLGGEVDGFLSRDVHLLITDKDGGGRLSKRPDGEIQSRGLPLSSVQNNQLALPLSRGKALLLRASQNAECGSSSQDPLENARSLGVKVQLANSFFQSTNKFLAQVKKQRSNKKKDDRGISPISWHKKDKDCNPVVKVEDLQHLYRPCMKQFEHFPTVKFNGDFGSPFSVGVVLFEQNDNNEQIPKKKASTRLMQIGGYCETCNHWFKCTMSEHLQSGSHKSFVSEPGNFDSLGKIINDLPDLTKFLSKYCSSDDHVPGICDKMDEEESLEKESALELLSEDVDQVLKEIGPNLDFDVPMETDSPGSETESYDIEKLLSDKQLISSPNVENVIDAQNKVVKVKKYVSFDKIETGSNCECYTPNASSDMIKEDNPDKDSSLSATNLRQKLMKWTIKDNIDKDIFYDDKFTHNDIIKSIKTEAVFSSSDHCFENNGIQDIISYLQQDSSQALNEVVDLVTDQYIKRIPDDENHKLEAVDNGPHSMLLGRDDPETPLSEALEAANNVSSRMEHEEANGLHSLWQTNGPEVDCIGVGSEIEIACEGSPICRKELPFDDVGKRNESSSPVIHIDIPCNGSHEKSEVEHSNFINDTDDGHCAVTCRLTDGPCSGSPDKTFENFDDITNQIEVPCNGPAKEFKISCSDASRQMQTPCDGLHSVCESSCHNATNQIKSTGNVSHNQNEAISNESSAHVEAVSACSLMQSITEYDGSSNSLISHMQSTETASSSEKQISGKSLPTETETPIDDSSCQTGLPCNVSSDGTPSYSCSATQNIMQRDPLLSQKETVFNNLVMQTETLSSDVLIHSEDSSSSILIPAVHNASSFQMQKSNFAIIENGAVNDNLTKQAETVKSDNSVNEQFKSDIKVKDLEKLENCNYNVSETGQILEQNSLTGSGIGDSSINIIDHSPLFSTGASNPTQPDVKLPPLAPDGTCVQRTFEIIKSPDTRFRTCDSTPSVIKVTTHPSFSISSLLDNDRVKYKKDSNALQKESLENLCDSNKCSRKSEEESFDNNCDERSITNDHLEPQINQTSHKFEFVYSPISSVYSDDADKLDNLSHMDADSGQETENYPTSPYCGKSAHDTLIFKPCRILRNSQRAQENSTSKCTKSSTSTQNKLDPQSVCADITRSSHPVTCLNSGRTDIVPIKVKGSAEVQIEQLPLEAQPGNAISALKMRSSLIARRTRSRKGSISQPMSPLCIDTTYSERSLSVPVTEDNKRDMSPFGPFNVSMDYNISGENTAKLADQRKSYQVVEEKSCRNGIEVPSSKVSCTIPATSYGIARSDFNFMMNNTKSIPVKSTCVNLGFSLEDDGSVGSATSPYDDSQISQDGHSTLSKSIRSPGHLIKLPASPGLKESERFFNQMTAVTITQPVSPTPVFTQTCSMYEKSLSPRGSCASSPYFMESPQPYSYVSPGMTRVQIPYMEQMIGSLHTAVDTRSTDGCGLTRRSSTSSVGSPLACLDPSWFSQQVQNQRCGFDNSPIPSPVNMPAIVLNTVAIPQNLLDNMVPQQSSYQIPEMQPDQPYSVHFQPHESFPVQNLTSSVSVGFVEHGQHERHHVKNSAMLQGTSFQSLPITGQQQSVIVKSDSDRQKILLVHNSSGGLNFLPLGLIKSSKSPQKKNAKKRLNRRSRKKDHSKAEIDSKNTNILDRALELSGVFCDGQQKINDSAFKTHIIHVADRTHLDSNYIKTPVPLDGVHPSYVYIQSDTYAEPSESGFIAQGQANLKPFCVVPVSKMSADNVMTSDANITEFPSSTLGDNSIVLRDLLDQAESELNDLLIDIGIINTGSQPVSISQIIEQDACNVHDVNMTDVIQTSAAKESLSEENKIIGPENNLLKETGTPNISKNELSGALSETSTGVSTVLNKEETKSTVVTKEIHKGETENEKYSVDIDGRKVSENTKNGESDSQVDSGLNDDIYSTIDSEKETADPKPFSVLGHLQNSKSSRKSAEKIMQSSRLDFQRDRSKENLSEISEMDLRPSVKVFQSCQPLPVSENNLSNQVGVFSLENSSHSTVKPLTEKNQNVTSGVSQWKNSIRSKCDILSQLNQHKLCAQRSTRVSPQINLQNSTSVSDLLSQINQYKHNTINNTLSHVGMDQQLINSNDFYTDSGKESADSEGLSDRTKRRLHTSRRKNKIGTKSPCTYTINKTGETKFKLCKVLLAPVQQKTNLLQLWRVQKQDGCRLVLSAKKRKANGFHNSSTDSINLNSDMGEQPQRKRRCLAY
ncbi:hypothetical protein CHS0354_010843 [Potamilus streckersoni]|uniref:DBF4-type domain-containing protein n=1 Tax=Potamilus streckersoni TaxID=2493646 RepID=A0AAE0WAF8_9BIVA|nr:hypothetical protein CHS0354_010843 [Potamilus streckersoni]